jgi:energy-coupling factor transport system permease protein
MIKDITLGQFFPGNSPLHRADPRTKLLLSILYTVGIFIADNLFSYLLLFVSAVILVLVSRISLRVILRGIRPIVAVLIFTALLNIFLTPAEAGEEALISFWRITVYVSGIRRAILMALRVTVLIIGTSVFLTYTTSPIRLTDGMESLLRPLALLHLPVHDFAMMMSIALRFIPTFVEETDKIMNAQKARGANFTSGGLIKRGKALLPILIPLFLSAIRRAEDLATAMECRCYHGGDSRTKMVALRYKSIDLYLAYAGVLWFVTIILFNTLLPIGNF